MLSNLLAKGANTRRRYQCNTPIIFATMKGNIPLVELLLSSGANVDDKSTRNGIRPVQIATENGNFNLFKLLVSANAKVDIILKKDSTHWGMSNQSCFKIACKYGRISFVRFLLSNKGANVNESDDNGFDHGRKSMGMG